MAAQPASFRTKIGLLLPQWERGMDRQTPGWSDIAELARLAEDIGADSLWVVDHLLIDRAAEMRHRGQPVPEKLAQADPLGVWEAWSLLAALAAITSRAELGAVVTCTGYRNPALLAKIAETVDEISGGRLILGVGAGDYRNEHEKFGYPWEKRIGRFEEAIQIISGLLRDGEIDFEGQFYSARQCVLRPRGPRPGGMPILIGSTASRPRMARLTMTYADIWNAWLAFGRSTVEEARARLEVALRACEANGRDPATLEKSLTIGAGVLGKTIPGAQPVTGDASEIAETINQFIELGYTHIQIYLAPMTPAGFEAFAPVLEQVRR
jgi:alkanesulfonate monooxygenase SsuD/methylene tetrahydromethanopterin reductase-like flavin-dependent oxidoreductase (luciferase family)